MRRILTTLLVSAAVSVGLVATAPSAGATSMTAYRTVSVTGDVNAPATYTPQQVASLPQVSVVGADGQTVTGASLEGLAASSAPRYDTGKNPLLRAAVTVSGDWGRARFAMGELDPAFGNHPALLVVRGNRVDLVVPGDRFPLRSVWGVRDVIVSVVQVAAMTPPSPGSVVVSTPRGAVTISAERLAALPEESRTVAFQAGTGAQTHTERGPSLLLVLLVAGVLPTPDRLVTAVGSDGYGASATAGEALVGGRPLLLSLSEDGTALTQPRLVPDGDVKGGRYVSGVGTLLTR